MNIIEFGTRVLRLNFSPLQEVFLRASEGESLTPAQAATFEKHAGRSWPGPGEPPSEVYCVTGRQSGKTGYLAATKVLHAAYDPRTVEGLEPGYFRDVLCVSPTHRQSRIAYNRIRALVTRTPELKRYLAGEPTQNEIELDFGVRIGVWTAKHASIRGTQARLLLLDEVCFLPSEGPRADEDLIEAARPGMAMLPGGGQVFGISTPWAEMGYVYELYRRRAELRDELVFQAASWELNPRISWKFLDRQRAKGESYYQREFAGRFVGTVDAFLPSGSVEACVARGRERLEPQEGVAYLASVDQAYRGDRFTLAIGHTSGDRVVIDRLRGWTPTKERPLRVDEVLDELIAEVAPYRITKLYGDQFGAVAFRELVRQRGLDYEEIPFTPESKRDLYGTLRYLAVSEKLELLDHPDSLRELRTIEAKVTPAGNVQIGAPALSGYRDDYADAIAILVHRLRPSAGFSEPNFALMESIRRDTERLRKEREKPEARPPIARRVSLVEEMRRLNRAYLWP